MTGIEKLQKLAADLNENSEEIKYVTNMLKELCEQIKQEQPNGPLGADGLPVRIGDVVYLAPGYREMAGRCGSDPDFSLCGIYQDERLDVSRLDVSRIMGARAKFVQCCAWCPVEWLTHTEPDTLEKIKEDAKECTEEYWDCNHVACMSCPAKVDGLNPAERFGVPTCHDAKCLDIVRRMEAIFKSEDGE